MWCYICAVYYPLCMQTSSLAHCHLLRLLSIVKKLGKYLVALPPMTSRVNWVTDAVKLSWLNILLLPSWLIALKSAEKRCIPSVKATFWLPWTVSTKMSRTSQSVASYVPFLRQTMLLGTAHMLRGSRLAHSHHSQHIARGHENAASVECSFCSIINVSFNFVQLVL